MASSAAGSADEASGGGQGGEATLSEWNTDFYVDLDRKNKAGFKSHVWSHFGSLKNRRTRTAYDTGFVFCKICVEVERSLKTK